MAISVRRTWESSIDFACRSAACRPPTSGGTGGSSSSGGSNPTRVKASQVSVGKNGTTVAGKPSSLQITKSDKGWAVTGSKRSFKTQAAAKSYVARTVSTAPAKPPAAAAAPAPKRAPRTARQIDGEISEAIRDSDNEGYGVTRNELRDAYNQAVRDGDKYVTVKLDYEMTLPKDLVEDAIWSKQESWG